MFDAVLGQCAHDFVANTEFGKCRVECGHAGRRSLSVSILVAVHARTSFDEEHGRFAAIAMPSAGPCAEVGGPTACTHISSVAAQLVRATAYTHDSWRAFADRVVRARRRLQLGHESDAAAASPEQMANSDNPGVSADHPGVNELFALLAYGEVAAFYRLTDEARMAPNLRGRINMASMAAAEMRHYEVLRDALARRGVDVVPAMTRYVSALENYHRLTTPSTWLEALVKTYIGDALAADFYLEIADALPDEVADVVRAVLSETGHSQFVVAEVRAAVTASEKQRHRLALWSRRLLGEAITQAQYVLADHDELVDLVMSSGDGLAEMTDFFDRLQRTHGARMHELGPGLNQPLLGAGRDHRVVVLRRDRGARAVGDRCSSADRRRWSRSPS